MYHPLVSPEGEYHVIQYYSGHNETYLFVNNEHRNGGAIFAGVKHLFDDVISTGKSLHFYLPKQL